MRTVLPQGIDQLRSPKNRPHATAHKRNFFPESVGQAEIVKQKGAFQI
jgi:hypothetical protein